jgi:hypothetical protein
MTTRQPPTSAELCHAGAAGHLVEQTRVGLGVTILLNGNSVLARQLIGAANPRSRYFDLYENISAGSIIDFAVDVGPASNMNFDATNFSVQILTSYATAVAATTRASGATLPISISGAYGIR